MRIGRLPTVTLALAMLISGMPLQAAQANHISGTLLPDLGMHYIRNYSIETTAGQTRLRFTTIITNIGDGPLQVRGHSLQSNGEMLVDQQIKDSSGNWTSQRTAFRMYFAGDGHSHWHVRDLATYTLQNAAATIKRTGEKHGFCFFDNSEVNLDLRHAPQSPRYLAGGCGKASSTSVTTGLSLGWGDKYAYKLPDQYINITNLPAGQYTLTAMVDSQGYLRERCEGNNITTAVLKITGTSVSVVTRGKASAACSR